MDDNPDKESVLGPQEILEGCVNARKKVTSFIELDEDAQKLCNQEEIHQMFQHLWLCDNTLAVIALTGSAHGSGLCTAMWHNTKKNLSHYSPSVGEHMMRVERPDLWNKIEQSKNKSASGKKPSIFAKLLYGITMLLIPEPKPTKEK